MAQHSNIVPALPTPSLQGASWPTFSVSIQERKTIMSGTLQGVNLQRTGVLPTVPPQYVQLSSSAAASTASRPSSPLPVIPGPSATFPPGSAITPVRSSGSPSNSKPTNGALTTTSPPLPRTPPNALVQQTVPAPQPASAILPPMPTSALKPGANMPMRSSGNSISSPPIGSSTTPTTTTFASGMMTPQQQTPPQSSGPMRSSGGLPTSLQPTSRLAPGQAYRSSSPTTPTPYGQMAVAVTQQASTLAKVSLMIACLSLVALVVSILPMVTALIVGVLPEVAAVIIAIAIVASFCSIPVLRNYRETRRSRVFAIWGIVLSILAILGEISRFVFHF